MTNGRIDLTTNDNLLEDYDCIKGGNVVKMTTSTPMPPSSPPENARESCENVAFLCTKCDTSLCLKARNPFSASACKNARKRCTGLRSTASRVSQVTKGRKCSARQSTAYLRSDTMYHSLKGMKVLQLCMKRLDVGHLKSEWRL